jgi:hypothetical protein
VRIIFLLVIVLFVSLSHCKGTRVVVRGVQWEGNAWRAKEGVVVVNAIKQVRHVDQPFGQVYRGCVTRVCGPTTWVLDDSVQLLLYQPRVCNVGAVVEVRDFRGVLAFVLNIGNRFGVRIRNKGDWHCVRVVAFILWVWQVTLHRHIQHIPSFRLGKGDCHVNHGGG